MSIQFEGDPEARAIEKAQRGAAARMLLDYTEGYRRKRVERVVNTCVSLIRQSKLTPEQALLAWYEIAEVERLAADLSRVSKTGAPIEPPDIE